MPEPDRPSPPSDARGKRQLIERAGAYDVTDDQPGEPANMRNRLYQTIVS